MTRLRPAAPLSSPNPHQDGRPGSPVDGQAALARSAGPPDALAGVPTPPRQGLERGEFPWPADARWRVAAWVTPDDLPRLAAALGPAADVIRCDSLDALSAAVRGGAAGAVVGAVADAAGIGNPDVADLAELVTRHPTTVFAGIAAEPEEPDETAALQGVLAAMFRRGPDGVLAFGRPAGDADWQLLSRSLASARLPEPVQRACVATVMADVWGAPRTGVAGDAGGPDGSDLFRFVAAAFAPGVDTVADAATRLGVDAAVLQARFVRHGLLGADRYVAAARLVRAVWTGEPPEAGAVAAAVAVVMRPVHPEAPARVRRVMRQVRRLAALGAGAPVARASRRRMLQAYRAALVVPFWGALHRFDAADGATA